MASTWSKVYTWKRLDVEAQQKAGKCVKTYEQGKKQGKIAEKISEII
jgi:hypothetical protein